MPASRKLLMSETNRTSWDKRKADLFAVLWDFIRFNDVCLLQPLKLSYMYSMNLPHTHISHQPARIPLISPTHLIPNTMFCFTEPTWGATPICMGVSGHPQWHMLSSNDHHPKSERLYLPQQSTTAQSSISDMRLRNPIPPL